ncbi:MAG TPA: pseudouridine synthase [Terriglobales bacterium]|nr:pseudouridine synthase [Terriglobales bacterium]
MPERRIGLARVLSKRGYCSRSRAVQLIRSGKVNLNGKVTRNPEAPVHESKDHIGVEGKLLASAEKVYFVLNKPRGIVTTASDEQGRATVYSLLPPDHPWVAPVGRLDKASEGLLLLTNDSEWAAGITDPGSHLDKTYHVQIAAIASEQLLTALTTGIRSGTELLKAKHATLLRSGQKSCWLEVILDEGRNRHIRRIFEALGIAVLRLVRVAMGPFQLGDLPKGAHRKLTSRELEMFDIRPKSS